MDWKTIGKLWFAVLLIFTLGTILMGCSAQRWSPTDPSLDQMDTSNLTVDATWELDVNADVTP